MSKLKKVLKFLTIFSIPTFLFLGFFFGIFGSYLVQKTGLLRSGTMATESHEKALYKKAHNREWIDVYDMKKAGEFLEDDNPVPYYEINLKATPLPNNKIAIFSHGLMQSKWKVLEYADMLAREGYKIITYDQRSMADNYENCSFTFGLEEADDLNNLFNTVYKKYSPTDVKFLGFSEGAVSSFIFESKYKENIKSKIGDHAQFLLESIYTSRLDALEYIVTKHYFTPYWFLAFGKPLLETYQGSRFERHEFSKYASNITFKTFFVITGKDEVVSPEGQMEMYNEVKKRDPTLTDYYYASNSNHTEGLNSSEGAAIWQKFLDFCR